MDSCRSGVQSANWKEGPAFAEAAARRAGTTTRTIDAVRFLLVLDDRRPSCQMMSRRVSPQVRLVKRSLQQVCHSKFACPVFQVFLIQRTRLHLEHPEQVAPLPVGNLATEPPTR